MDFWEKPLDCSRKSRFCLLPVLLFVTIHATAAEVVRYSDFGAVGDGKTDDFAALAKAHAHANEKDLPVVAENGATYYVGGADRTIPILTSTDFGKARFVIDDTRIENHRAHVFEVRSRHRKVRLKGVEALKRGQKRIAGKVPGPCLILARDDTTKRFIRRGKNRNSGSSQTDVFLVDAFGRVDERTPIIWDFKELSRLEAFPIDKKELVIRGGHFTTIARSKKSTSYHARGISIRRSNVRVEGLQHHIQGEGKEGPPYRGFISISLCSNVILKNVVVTGRKTYYKIGNAGKRVPMGSYGISISSAIDVALVDVTQSHDIMDRKRWGIIGTNFCKNLLYDGCELSRFDAHQGVTNATIRNSTIGYMAVKLTGFGTFLMEDTTVQGRQLISLRQDYGSTWNGEIMIRDCTLKYTGGGGVPAVISGFNDGQHDFGYVCYLPTRVVIDGLRIEDGERGKAYEGPVVFGAINPDFKPGAKLPHPQVMPRQVAWRRVETTSGKPLRLSDQPAMHAGTEVLSQ